MSATAPVKSAKRPAKAGARASKPPAPRDQSVVGTYESLKRPKVIELMDASKWAVISTRLLPDLHRTTGGGAKAAVISIIEMHTAGRVLGPGGNKLKIQRKDLRPEQWSPNLTTSDFAKLTGYSKRQCLKAITWAAEQGFIARRGKTGEARVQFRLDYDAIRRAPNAADPDELEERFRQRAEAETDENPKLQDSEKREVKEGGCRTPGPLLLISPGRPMVLAKLAYSDPASGEMVEGGKLVLETDHPVGCTATIAPSGEIRVKVSRPEAGEIPDAAEAQAAPDAARRRPAPSTVVTEKLAKGLRELGLPVSDTLARELAGKLPDGCTPEAALKVVQERVERPGAKQFNLSYLPGFFVDDVPAKWQSFEKRKPPTSTNGGGGQSAESAVTRAMRRRLGGE